MLPCLKIPGNRDIALQLSLFNDEPLVSVSRQPGLITSLGVWKKAKSIDSLYQSFGCESIQRSTAPRDRVNNGCSTSSAIQG